VHPADSNRQGANFALASAPPALWKSDLSGTQDVVRPAKLASLRRRPNTVNVTRITCRGFLRPAGAGSTSARHLTDRAPSRHPAVIPAPCPRYLSGDEPSASDASGAQAIVRRSPSRSIHGWPGEGSQAAANRPARSAV